MKNFLLKKRVKNILAFSGVYLLFGCANETSNLYAQKNIEEISAEEITGPVYIVKSGDILSIIALQHGESYQNLANWNGINPPYIIYPGQRLRLTPPNESLNITNKNIYAKKNESNKEGFNKENNIKKSPFKNESSNIANNAIANNSEKIKWQLPAKGKIINKFSLKTNGLDILGQQGDPIFAAAKGKVVYSGSGIIGYGKLIIIKHDNTYLSSYGHNKKLLVKEGDSVSQGQQIAEMGFNQKNQTILHFEIRHNGKSVDPLMYIN